MRLSLIAMVLCLCAAWPGHGLAWGMVGSADPAEGEVRFYAHPYPVSYGFISKWNPVAAEYIDFSAEHFTEGMVMRVQLANTANPDGVVFRFGEESEPAQALDNGGFWVPDENLSKNGDDAHLHFRMYSSEECTVKYTVSVYPSQDLTANPLASSTHEVRYLMEDKSPRMESLSRTSGDLNEDIPFAINVTKAGFLQGQHARMKIYLYGPSEGLTLSGQNLSKETSPYNESRYVLDIPSFSATQFTLMAHATEEWNGTVQVDICDADDNRIVYGGQAPFVFPANNSQDDIAALKAIAEANPLNSDLRNFISNKDYLKDRGSNDGYNVGVTWNTESTSRVKSFFINDGRTRTITSMDVSALSGLEQLDLQNTRLKSLDLSTLTKLRSLSLYGNDSLAWFTVKLPSPLPENFWIGGNTTIMAGTPVDDYNAYAAKGEEIDLSAYASVGGVKSVYQWYLIDRATGEQTEATMLAVSGKEGAFVFTGKPGEYYMCEITNPNYGNWRMNTVQIKVARNSDSYSPADIAGLKKLAADNPNITQLKEFVDSKEEKYGDYYCKLMNPKFCRITEINVRDGWQIETSRIHVETTVPQVFAESDVATLARIVDASNNKELSEWWSSGAWQTNENSQYAQVIWNDENPRRLVKLYMYQMGNSFTKEVDLSALDKLQELSLYGNRVEKLTLPKNSTVLSSLMLAGNTPLSTLIVSMYPALEYLDVSNTGLKACDVSNNKNLRGLFLSWTEIKPIEETCPEIAALLQTYGVPKTTTSIDLDRFPALKALHTSGSALEFSGVQNPRQLESAEGDVLLAVGKARLGGFSLYGEKIDLSAQATVAGTVSDYIWAVNNDTIDFKDNQYTIAEELMPNDLVVVSVTNPLFPGWRIRYVTTVYTCDGDANLDKSVNVQDVTATVSYILEDKDNMIPNFGFAEADVNYNNNVEIADVIGIVNLIHGKPVTKAGALRSESEVPVQMELDADNFLTMNSQVPVAGIYLELVGVIDEIPLLGDAAKFLQASSLNGDTLRVIGYSLDGRTIPSGKSRILRMPAGVTLVGASFSDAKANSLRSGGDAIVTSNAPIEAISQLAAVSNYPNPFRGSTTFRYQLTEAAKSVTIHVFSANGALAVVLNGLPGEVGDNQYSAALTLPAGVYYYRLTAKTGHGVKASNTNIFICK